MLRRTWAGFADFFSLEPKVGKDSLLEGWRYAIGSANWAETTPKAMLNSQFNGYRKSVVLRINECHDLGEHSRFEFYDHMKDLSASGPFALPVNEKHRAEYYIPNATAPVLTTNHRLVFYVLANDRRNLFCWSVCNGSEFDETYWNAFYAWYEAGGYENVAAYLMARDLSRFDPKAAPFKTPWFWESVESSRDAEEPEMLDTIEKIGFDNAFTLDDLKGQAAVTMDLWDLLNDPKKRRVVSHRLEKCGYMPVRNPDVTSGLWMVAGKRKVVYAGRDLSPSAQMDAVLRRVNKAEDDAAQRAGIPC